jgi:hypothetical protein
LLEEVELDLITILPEELAEVVVLAATSLELHFYLQVLIL